MKHKAVAEGILVNAEGRRINMAPGPCLWCGEWVFSQRDVAGCTNPFDPAWATEDGDFGCDRSPETLREEGVGDHARPYDLALRLMRKE